MGPSASSTYWVAAPGELIEHYDGLHEDDVLVRVLES
jgi:hypothetical protein